MYEMDGKQQRRRKPSSSTTKRVSLSTIFLCVQCAAFPIIPILSSM